MQRDDKGVADTVTRLLLQQQEEEKRKAVLEEEREEFSRALNHVFDTDDGVYVLNQIIKYCNLSGFEKTGNPAKMLEDNTRRRLFNEVFLAFLDNSVKQKLEYL